MKAIIFKKLQLLLLTGLFALIAVGPALAFGGEAPAAPPLEIDAQMPDPSVTWVWPPELQFDLTGPSLSLEQSVPTEEEIDTDYEVGTPGSTEPDISEPVPTPPQSPTIVVAASDSARPEEGHLVCDGINDEVEIQAAIDALPESGGRVLLLDGTFYIAADGYIDLRGKLTIQGQGNSTVLAKTVASANNMGVMVARGFTSPHNEILLDNLKIDIGNPQSETLAFYASYVNGLTFHNIHFVCGSRQGKLHIAHSNQVSIITCTLDGLFVHVMGQTIPGDDTAIDSTDVTVEGCTFKNTPYNHLAIGNLAKKWRIIDNSFYNCGYTAIDISYSPDSLISGNDIDTCVCHGIYSEGGRRLIITGNVVKNIPDNWGIVCNDQNGYGYAGDIVIEDNVISDCKGGILLWGTPDAAITDNQIYGSNWHGIFLARKTVDGTIFDSDDCTLSGNCVFDFGKTWRYSRGIMLDHCKRGDVYGNNVDGCDNTNAYKGIAEYGEADYNAIERNTVRRVTVAIYVVGANTLVEGNVI